MQENNFISVWRVFHKDQQALPGNNEKHGYFEFAFLGYIWLVRIFLVTSIDYLCVNIDVSLDLPKTKQGKCSFIVDKFFRQENRTVYVFKFSI